MPVHSAQTPAGEAGAIAGNRQMSDHDRFSGSDHFSNHEEFRLVAGARGFSFGQARYRNGGRFGPITEPFLTLCCVFGGEVSLTVDGDAPIHLGSHEIGLIYNHERLVYDYPLGTDTHVGWVEAQPTLPAGEIDRLLSLLPRQLSGNDDLFELINMGLRLKPGPDSGRALLELNHALGVAAISAWLYQADRANRAGRDSNDSRIPVVARLALRYIQSRYIYPIQLGDIADEVRVSPQYLTRVFNRTFGITPMRYVWRIRTLAALEALRRSNSTLAEIASGCGYQTPYHLSRHIKALTGRTPGEIRNGAEFQTGTDEIPSILTIEF